MDFTRVDTEVEAHEVVENWSVELHMDGLFAINHHGVWFYLAHSLHLLRRLFPNALGRSPLVNFARRRARGELYRSTEPVLHK